MTSFLRPVFYDPSNLVWDVAVLGRDPGEVVGLLVVEGDLLVLAVLQLFELGPRDTVAGVLVESHGALGANQETYAYLIE